MGRSITHERSSRWQHGFTLIEIVVGIGIFVVLVSAVLSLFLGAIRAQQKSIQTQNVMDNSRFVLEKISRAIRQSNINTASFLTELRLCHPRLGYDASVGCDCASGTGFCLDYRATPDGRVQERAADNDGDGCAWSVPIPCPGNVLPGGDNDDFSITSSNVVITDLRFEYAGLPSGDGVQQRVTMFMTVEQAASAKKPYEQAKIHLQTTVTPRRLDIAAGPSPPVVIPFPPEADAFVNGDTAITRGTNYGTDPRLRTDASPTRNSYLRFNVQGVATVNSATLRIFANGNNPIGFRVHGVTDNSWGELTITYNNAPSFDPVPVGSSGPVAANTWYEVDVTSLVTGNGLVSFALTSTSGSNTYYSSKEGANPPQLVIETQ